jgi:hypothetical protein
MAGDSPLLAHMYNRPEMICGAPLLGDARAVTRAHEEGWSNACLMPQKLLPCRNGKAKAREHPEKRLAEVGCTEPIGA